MPRIPTLEELKRLDTSHDLILSLTLTGEIIQFNKESEHVTGFLRDEVLHKRLSEILIPKESEKQWNDLLDSIRQDLWIDNFVLPIKTKNHQVQMITWTGFLVKDEHGTIKDICIFGKPLQTDIPEITPPVSSEPETPQPTPEIPPEDTQTFSPVALEEIPPPKRDVPIRHGVNKILFAREKTSIDRPAPPRDSEPGHTPLMPLGKPVGDPSQQWEGIHQSLADLSQKYQAIADRVAELEKKGQYWEEQHQSLDTPQQPLEEEENTFSATTLQDTSSKGDTSDQQPTEETEQGFFSNPFGLKRHSKELDLQRQQLELRTKELEAFEARLQREERTLNARVDDFSKWQEKLLLLESAIEKRRQELMKQEGCVLEKRTPSPDTPAMDHGGADAPGIAGSEISHCTDETLEKIPQSAAIIQRGIVKQINTSFMELLGYNLDELVEKSYFDFIAFEGLADVEKYYLDRLKGDGVSTYRTVFSTKDSTKIPVEVVIKQTIYNGEKAEIVIITCFESSK
ncbi:MAG: PAS domain S-box protein [Candidatus Thermoplasmatota archaeon]|nr:PAS domain S-box protein [Candidatus Thermoplasmatota archaeon]